MKPSYHVPGVILALALLGGMAFAGDAMDGKVLYRTNCRVCHDKGSKHGQYTPMSLAQEQWRKFFSAKLVREHKDAVVPNTNKKLLETLSPEQIKAIQRFCIGHAADSEQPATCGG